jgi:hypothetical protein
MACLKKTPMALTIWDSRAVSACAIWSPSWIVYIDRDFLRYVKVTPEDVPAILKQLSGKLLMDADGGSEGGL